MSRIQEILKKAEREGTVQRTRPLVADGPSGTAAAPAIALPAPWALAGREAHSAREAADASDAVPRAASRTATGTLDSRLVAAFAPQSLAAEQYRSLRTRIKAAESGRSFRAIVVTSPNKGDGKSLTAGNLALTMAQEFQQRVLLIDADLRRPSLHHLFGIGETPGLSDVLMGGATLESALVEIPEHHLTVLPSGVVPVRPAELLGSAGMRRVLDTLRARYDRLILDMPPVAPLADVSIAAGMVDGILMIVRAGVTPKPAIERALAGLEVSKVIGLVLNDAGDDRGSYEYGGYGYVAG
jgi:capsular exopolysaccharide synthesis family protein